MPSWPPVMMNAATLLRISTLLLMRDLVLHAVHALDHLVVERTRRAPADRRRDQQDVGPVHGHLVHLVELVGLDPSTVIEHGQVQALAALE